MLFQRTSEITGQEGIFPIHGKHNKCMYFLQKSGDIFIDKKQQRNVEKESSKGMNQTSIQANYQLIQTIKGKQIPVSNSIMLNRSHPR